MYQSILAEIVSERQWGLINDVISSTLPLGYEVENLISGISLNLNIGVLSLNSVV